MSRPHAVLDPKWQVSVEHERSSGPLFVSFEEAHHAYLAYLLVIHALDFTDGDIGYREAATLPPGKCWSVVVPSNRGQVTVGLRRL